MIKKALFGFVILSSFITILKIRDVGMYNTTKHSNEEIPQEITTTKIIAIHSPSMSNGTEIQAEKILTTIKPTRTTPLVVIPDLEVQNRFERRRLLMQTVCMQKSRSPQHRPRFNIRAQSLEDLPRRLLVCAVPKSGSTSWHYLMWSLERKRLNMSQNHRLYTSNDTLKLINKSLNLNQKDWDRLITITKDEADFSRDPPANSSFRVILARHPFARFISGWNQKFLLRINYWVYLMKRFPNLINYKKEIDPDHVFSFGDFAQFAAENQRAIRVTDAHFAPATTVCSPCRYNFTYVVKAESIDDDEHWLLKRLGLSDVGLSRNGSPVEGSPVNSDLKGNIKKFMQKLSPETIRGLFELYRDDFEIFGYTFDFNTLEAGGFE